MEQGNAAVRGNRLGSTEKEGHPFLLASPRKAAAGLEWSRSDLGNNEGLAISTTGHAVRGLREFLDELLRPGLKGDPWPQRGLSAAEINAILVEILAAAIERVGQFLFPSIVARMASGGDSFPSR